MSRRRAWESEAITEAGGIYRMCWCAGGFTCTGYEAFRVDVGALLLVGPSSTDLRRTCVSGRACEIRHVYTDDLSRQRRGTCFGVGDRLRVLDTCGVASELPRFAGDALATEVSHSGATFAWGTQLVSGAGGHPARARDSLEP